MSEHTNSGNCWSRVIVYGCTRNGCREGEVCDVCHDHDEPRGECSECPKCGACDSA